MYLDEMAAIATSMGGATALLELLLILGVMLNMLKGPLLIVGLALWRAKWGTVSQKFGRIGAAVAGFYTWFDWNSFEFTIDNLLLAALAAWVSVVIYDYLVVRLDDSRLA